MNTIRYVGQHAITYDVCWHTHENWELVYCTEGDGTFRFEDGSTLCYRKGQAVAIPPGKVHSNISSVGFTNIHLRMEEPTFPQKTPFLVADDAEGHMGEAFFQARFFYLEDSPAGQRILTALGELISSYMVAFQDNPSFAGPVEELRTMIIQNFENPSFELNEAIQRQPFNTNYLRKQFQDAVGLTPLRYMTNLRMRKARYMLLSPSPEEHAVSRVAESCGYRDALYFSRVFKKHFGCSPTDFVARQGQTGEGEPPQQTPAAPETADK